jgi:hypothetical protein
LFAMSSATNHSGTLSELDRLAGEYLVPHQNDLADEAKRLLAKNRKLPLADRSLWKPHENQATSKTLSREEMATLCRQIYPDKRNKSVALPEDFALAIYWNPIVAAQQSKKMVQGRTMSPINLARQMQVEAMIGETVWVVDDNTAAPVIAFQNGDEMCHVALERTDGGYYLPTDVKWLYREPKRENDGNNK